MIYQKNNRTRFSTNKMYKQKRAHKLDNSYIGYADLISVLNGLICKYASMIIWLESWRLQHSPDSDPYLTNRNNIWRYLGDFSVCCVVIYIVYLRRSYKL